MSKLTRKLIVETASSLLDEKGAKPFSMRGLAAKLGVDPMAVYHHFANKSELIASVLEDMLSSYAPPEPTGDWRTDIKGLSEAVRDLARRRPGAFRIFELYPDYLDGERDIHERYHATLRTAGFSKRSTVGAVRILIAYVEAFAIDEIDDWLVPEDRDELERELSEDRHPTLRSLIDELTDRKPDDVFDQGMAVILSGLEDTLRREGAQ